MLSLERAVDVFVLGWQCQRGLTWPLLDTYYGPIRILRDAPGRKADERTQELLMVLSGDPETIEEQVVTWMSAYRELQLPRHLLCVISPEGVPPEPIKQRIKVEGFRLQRVEPFFVRDLREPLPEPNERQVLRVRTEYWADVLHRAMRRTSVVRLQDLTDLNPEVRHYLAIGDDQRAIGWVRSIQRTTDSAWVADLQVHPSYRRQGFGYALMARLLQEDRESGADYSVLLASVSGARLYPRLGYQRIGVLQLFAPLRWAETTPPPRLK